MQEKMGKHHKKIDKILLQIYNKYCKGVYNISGIIDDLYSFYISKGCDSVFTIGQVARLLKVHSQTLRNWEKQGLVFPQRFGQSRIYSDADIKQCKRIKGMSGRGVQLQIIKNALKIKSFFETEKGGEAV